MDDGEELARRMAGPQRHRLLQGYPMLPLMRSAVATPGQLSRMRAHQAIRMPWAAGPRARRRDTGK